MVPERIARRAAIVAGRPFVRGEGVGRIVAVDVVADVLERDLDDLALPVRSRVRSAARMPATSASAAEWSPTPGRIQAGGASGSRMLSIRPESAQNAV